MIAWSVRRPSHWREVPRPQKRRVEIALAGLLGGPLVVEIRAVDSRIVDELPAEGERITPEAAAEPARALSRCRPGRARPAGTLV